MHTRVDDALPVGPADAKESETIETIQLRAEVVGTASHPASGTARIVQSEGIHYLRYEDFSTLNGPDLYVYLSKDKNAKDFVNLGRLKATEGNVNYEIPVGTNLDEYRYALVWCRAFGVLFNTADLASPAAHP